MEKILYRAEERGRGDFGWLTTRYSFSFANWYNPALMGFGALRVLNDDVVAPGTGFGTHEHDNMEIITIVKGGTVTHKDSIGSSGTVSAGEVQVMSAGTGVAHSEVNDSPTEFLILFQLWIESNERNVAPRYDQKAFGPSEETFTLLVSPDGREDSLSIHQDAFISQITLGAGSEGEYALKKEGNGIFIFVVSGSVLVEEETLHDRDAIGLAGYSTVLIRSDKACELLVVEVPMIA